MLIGKSKRSVKHSLFCEGSPLLLISFRAAGHRQLSILTRDSNAMYKCLAYSVSLIYGIVEVFKMSSMKAVIHYDYGSLDELQIESIERPVIKDTEVSVRVHAAGLHVADCFGVKGSPFPMRLVSGLLKPKYGVPGFDLAGEVHAVGFKVTRFKVGDAVFGIGKGTCAEFASASEETLAHKPDTLSYEEAAAVPTAALAALHALRDAGKLRPGQRVLINGASGGVGSFAIQIAKNMGAYVTGVCGRSNIEFVRNLGADFVIDYRQEDFTQRHERYNLILDNVENRSLADCRRVLTANGTLLLNSGTGARGFPFLVRLLKPLLLSPFVRHNFRRYLSTPNQADLNLLKGLLETGKLAPIVGHVYSLDETSAALRLIDSGHARGKVVVTIP